MQAELFDTWQDQEIRSVRQKVGSLLFEVRVYFRESVFSYSYRVEFKRPDCLGMGTPFICERLESSDSALLAGLTSIAEWLLRIGEHEALSNFHAVTHALTTNDLLPAL